MLLVSDFRLYIESIQTHFPQIVRNKVVMDDTQLNKFLADEVVDDDNYTVVGIIPKHKPIGNEDTVQSKDIASLLILKKITRSDKTHEDFLDDIGEAQVLTRAVILKMREDKMRGDCKVMTFLQIPTMDINPVWGLSSCDGYEIDFSLETNF